jgi:hypothetical protein
MLDAIIAITIKYRPVATLKAVAEPPLDHGETAEKPTPAPNVRRIRLIAAAAAPPARIAAHETADAPASSPTAAVSMIDGATIEYSLELVI